MQILVQDPAIMFAALYTSLVYGIFCSLFEVFPVVYIGPYNFDFGQMSLTFLFIAISTTLSVIAYFSYYSVLESDNKANGFGPPEQRLRSALYVFFLLPIGLFLFGWTSNGHIHWIVSIVGIGIYAFGVFIVLQCIFLNVPLTYPEYAGQSFRNQWFREICRGGRGDFVCKALVFEFGNRTGGQLTGCV